MLLTDEDEDGVYYGTPRPAINLAGRRDFSAACYRVAEGVVYWSGGVAAHGKSQIYPTAAALLAAGYGKHKEEVRDATDG